MTRPKFLVYHIIIRSYGDRASYEIFLFFVEDSIRALRARCCYWGALLATPSVFAAYPDRPITIVVPYPSGGSSDTLARILTPKLAERLKQSLIAENSSGAGGSIGTVRTVRAASDGYTLLLGSGSEVLINKLINPQVAYDGLKDLAPIAMIGTAPMVVLGKSGLAG